MSPSPRGDGTEVPVGRVAVPKTGQKTPSPREDGTEVLVGRVAVSKTGQKNALPRGDATERHVGAVSVLGESHEPEPEGHSKCPQRNVGWHFGKYF